MYKRRDEGPRGNAIYSGNPIARLLPTRLNGPEKERRARAPTYTRRERERGGQIG